MKQEMNDQDVLLVKEKNESKLKAVKGFDENGKLQTELPNKPTSPVSWKLIDMGIHWKTFLPTFIGSIKTRLNFDFSGYQPIWLKNSRCIG